MMRDEGFSDLEKGDLSNALGACDRTEVSMQFAGAVVGKAGDFCRLYLHMSI